MGQTLTHGIYLPDKGERNCYNGLAANWQLLDGAVGTIAEHTSALSDKAPLVHTHTKADITDFPALATVATSGSYNDLNNIPASFTPASHTHGNLTNDGKVGTTANKPLITGTDGIVQAGSFGTSANTFCEGNDSRLSDARTPVAHTHTKSDVTDLLNSDFIPSANNSYDLGSSSYQWNNLYAKNYYYNGVAWGLDKANTWSGVNTYTSILQYKWLTSGGYSDFRFKDQNNITQFILRVYSHDVTLAKKSANGSNAFEGAQINFSDGGTLKIQTYDGTNYHVFNFTPTSVYPSSTNATDLGTSTNKWKTLNGLNPGALSLPNFDSDGYVDLSSNLTENVQYTYNPTVDGWLALFAQVDGFHAENAVGIFNADSTLGSDSFRWAASATAAINLSRQTGKYYGSVILPVKAGYRYYCWLRVDQSTTLGLKKLIFYKAKGNV